MISEGNALVFNFQFSIFNFGRQPDKHQFMQQARSVWLRAFVCYRWILKFSSISSSAWMW